MNLYFVCHYLIWVAESRPPYWAIPLNIVIIICIIKRWNYKQNIENDVKSVVLLIRLEGLRTEGDRRCPPTRDKRWFVILIDWLIDWSVLNVNTEQCRFLIKVQMFVEQFIVRGKHNNLIVSWLSIDICSICILFHFKQMLFEQTRQLSNFLCERFLKCCFQSFFRFTIILFKSVQTL